MSLQSSKDLDSIFLRRFGKDPSAPGVQVSLVNGQGQVVYEKALGLANPVADPKGQEEALTTSHRCNLYSMTKFFTACAILKLIETEQLRAQDQIQDVLPQQLGHLVPKDCTIQDLVAHQAGAPNPLPLAWVHPPEETIDETQRLMDILKSNSFQLRGEGVSAALPYKYSNIGYWLLGQVVLTKSTNENSHATKNDFSSICQRLLNLPKSISDQFDPQQGPMAYGHVALWSPLALAGFLLCPRWSMGPKSWKWIRMEPHCLDGVAYGGLIGSSRDVSTWLGKLLQGSILTTPSYNKLFQPINKEMTFGLHIRQLASGTVYHKEGGGAGHHSSLQIRPDPKLAGCAIACDASFDVNGLLDEMMDYIQSQ